ncbi:MAG: hypothetical protein KAV87_37130 [Desulfobacteraceae bacterium]|nr:hypothetical protein [Desulfobacteraceae bacterium]
MLRKDFIIGYSGIVLALILAGLFAPLEKAIVGNVCILVGLVMAVAPGFFVLYRTMRCVRIFSDDKEALDFVKRAISEVCEKGGTVFSTYVLEDPHGTTDIVSENLSQAKRPVQYRRLILIDDPETELAWLSRFLMLSKHRYLTVTAHLVSNQGRLVSRFIRKAIPFINIFLVKYDSSLSQSLFLLTFPRRSPTDTGDQYKFAIAIKNDPVMQLALSYFDNLLASAGSLIREVRSIEQYTSWRTIPLPSQKTMSIVETIKECAENLPEIVHVGVFGSVAHRLAGTYVDRFSKEYENDLDLVVVLREAWAKETIKNTLRDAIHTAQDDTHVEWSNESPEFYWIREQYQIDMQIHTQNDSYYIDHPLLGWSIFSNYFVLYSDAGKPVNELIGIPTQLLDMSKRSLVCLDDEKFGVRRFIRECESENPKIDPRRVISINTRNFAWALAGARPYSISQSFTLVSKHLDHSLRDKLQLIQRRSTSETSQKQREDLKTVNEYLRKIANRLEEMAHE